MASIRSKRENPLLQDFSKIERNRSLPSARVGLVKVVRQKTLGERLGNLWPNNISNMTNVPSEVGSSNYLKIFQIEKKKSRKVRGGREGKRIGI